MPYAPRIVDAQVADLLADLPAVAIEGAKGVGKTSTAEQRARTVLRLDRSEDLTLLQADRDAIRRALPPLLIDEWQNDPEIWNVVRRLVDDQIGAGSFLLTGSANVRDARVHSGAGRIVRVRMRPLSYAERQPETSTVSLARLAGGTVGRVDGETDARVADYAREIVASGFPGVRAFPERRRRTVLGAYIDNVLQHDVPALGAVVRRPASLRAWLTSYAAASATSAAYESIADAVDGPSRAARSTIHDYRDALSALWMLDPVPAWEPGGVSLGKVGRAPKHHLADPALAAVLLGADEHRMVGPAVVGDGSSGTSRFGDGPLLGRLFESLVTLSVRVYAQAIDLEVGHFRTSRGDHEVDLILHAADGRAIAIEVKLAESVDDRDVRHLNWLGERMGGRLIERLIITTGRRAYRRADGVAVVPLALLGP